MATNSRTVGDETLAIAAEVRAQRSARRWKQQEVSARTGIPVNTLSKIERGLTVIDVEQTAKIAGAFGMLSEELIGLARQNAALRDGNETVYQTDGSLNPANTRGFEPTPGDINELLSRDEDASG